MNLEFAPGRRATPEERVLYAVVLMAISDACTRPNARSPASVAMDAHDFIWSDRLESYLNWLEIEPAWFRWKLTQVMESRRESGDHFSSEQRRAFRYNRSLYAQLGSPKSFYDPDKEEG